MLAMRDDEMMVMVFVFLTGLTVLWIVLAYRQRRERLVTIQKALEAGNIDETTRRALLQAIASDAQHAADLRRKITANAARFAQIAVFVVGWLTFTIGGCVMLCMIAFDGSRYDVIGAGVATAIGFGLITLPLALRELEARRTARSQ